MGTQCARTVSGSAHMDNGPRSTARAVEDQEQRGLGDVGTYGQERRGKC
jgi:hypothetical protein